MGEFSQMAMVCYGQFFEIYRNCLNFWATLFACKSSVSILTNDGLGCVWGYFLQTHLDIIELDKGEAGKFSVLILSTLLPGLPDFS
jgi:hypothetical protein